MLPPTERQRAATRQVILDAAFRMMREERTVAFSHEPVAAGARVAVRTVYCRFPAIQGSESLASKWVKDSDPLIGCRAPRSHAGAHTRETTAAREDHAGGVRPSGGMTPMARSPNRDRLVRKARVPLLRGVSAVSRRLLQRRHRRG